MALEGPVAFAGYVRDEVRGMKRRKRRTRVNIRFLPIVESAGEESATDDGEKHTAVSPTHPITPECSHSDRLAELASVLWN